MKLNTEWSQDIHGLTVRLPLRRIDPSKIDVIFFPTHVKVNIPERSIMQFLDLFGEVDFPKCKWVFSDNTIGLTLVKARPGFWDSLEVIGLSKQDIRIRRQEATTLRQDWEAQKTADSVQLRQHVEKQAVEEKYAQEREFQQKIKAKMDAEKSKALDSIFEAPAVTSQLAVPNSPSDLGAIAADPELRNEIDHSVFLQNNGRILSTSEVGSFNSRGRSDVEAPVRSRQEGRAVQLSFSKKVFPYLATREQHFTEPPMPKDSKQANKSEGETYLWYKERGDGFQRDRDFRSAANAYQEALKLNPDSTETTLNSACLKMRVMEFDEALRLVDHALELLKNKSLDQQLSLALSNALKKKLWILAQTGRLKEALETADQLEKLHTLGSDSNQPGQTQHDSAMQGSLERIRLDQKTIQNRLESEQSKLPVDTLVEQGKMAEALQAYITILNSEPENEKLIANCVYLHSKLGNAEAAQTSSATAIELVTNSLQECALGTEECNKANESLKFLLKLYIRRTEAFLSLNDVQKAEETIRAARRLDEHNSLLLEKSKEVKRVKNRIAFEEKRSECRQKMESGDFVATLALINECDVLLDLEKDVIEVLKISANKVVCFLRLQKFDNVVAETLRALKIIAGLRSNFLSPTYSENKGVVDQLEQKLRMRKAFALSSMGQVFNAKQEVEKVLQMDPKNAEAKRILEDFKLVVC